MVCFKNENYFGWTTQKILKITKKKIKDVHERYTYQYQVTV